METELNRPSVGDGRFYIGDWLVDPGEDVMASVTQDVVWLNQAERDLLVMLSDRPRVQVPSVMPLREIFSDAPNPGRAYLETVVKLKKYLNKTPGQQFQMMPVLHMFENGDLMLVRVPELGEQHPLAAFLRRERQTNPAAELVQPNKKGSAIASAIQFIFWLLLVAGPLVLEAC